MSVNWVTVAIGLAALVYGFLSIVWRVRDPARFGKLGPMQEAWGEQVGGAWHVWAYTVVPILCGIYLVIMGVLGYSFGRALTGR